MARKIIRNFFSDTLKDMLKLSDAEYQKLYEEIGDKTITELDKTHPNIAAKLREMFDSRFAFFIKVYYKLLININFS